MAYDQDGLNGASSSGQATYIPEPGSAVDNAYNRRKAGDVRLRSDAAIFGDDPNLVGGGAGYYFRRIAMHEMGHTLGFGHNTVSDSVMGGGSVSELGLGEGDIEGAVAIYGPDAVIGDFVAPAGVDLADFAVLADQWLSTPGSPSADIAEPLDDFVDMADLAVFCDNWLAGTE
jgi:hypothetical protein